MRDEETLHQRPDELSTASLSAICDHLEATHHAFLKEELPRLEEMLEIVARIHGARFTNVFEVLEAFVPFAEDVLMHLHKEERVLFPAIRQLAAGAHRDVSASVVRMMLEHDRHRARLRRLRELADDYEVPAAACDTFRAVLVGLAELERDLHAHIHMENHILFPRTLERLPAGGASGWLATPGRA